MEDVSLSDAKARLSELVERAVRGETIRIAKRGKVVAQLSGIPSNRSPVDIEALRALTASMPAQVESAGEWLREIRDDERY